MQAIGVGGLDKTVRTRPVLDLASTDETAMATTMARVIVAMEKWLNTVGAERSGRTAVSHRHGKLWIIILDVNSMSLDMKTYNTRWRRTSRTLPVVLRDMCL